MGIPSMRRKASVKGTLGAPTTEKPSTSALPQSAENSDVNIAKKGSLDLSASAKKAKGGSKPTLSIPKTLLPRLVSTKNARSGSTSSGEGTAAADTTISSLLLDSSSNGIDSADPPKILLQPKMQTTTTTNAQQTKRSVHLSISPDDESESMQVMLMEGVASPVKRGDCIYSVDSVEYLVKHDALSQSEISAQNVNVVCPKLEESNPEQIIEESEEENNNDFMQELGGSEKKSKSKMGGLFKKSGKKGNDNGGGNNQQEGSGNNNNDRDGDGNNKKDGAGHSNNDDEDKKDSNGNDGNRPNNPGGAFDPLAYFGPTRNQFAVDSTLPIHSGSEASAPKDHPSWTPVDGKEFRVRVGPNYPKTGKKEASAESLYEVYCVRYFRSKKRTVGGATRIMSLPDGEGKRVENGEGSEGNEEDAPAPIEGGKHFSELDGTKIPDVLVVHFMLPYEPPNMFKQKDDGPGGECIYYLRPSQRFLDEISGRVPATPASTLFAKWCAECEHDLKMRSRFKCMALVRDIDKHNFGLLKNYNGKPVLITESGRASSGFHGDVRYLEMTANGEKYYIFSTGIAFSVSYIILC